MTLKELKDTLAKLPANLDDRPVGYINCLHFTEIMALVVELEGRGYENMPEPPFVALL